MAEGYKIRDQYKPHFVTFTVTDWVDIFTRPIYKNVAIDSMQFCIANKGLIDIVIMPSPHSFINK